MGIDRMLRLTPCILSASATQRFAFGTRLALSAKNVPRADAPPQKHSRTARLVRFALLLVSSPQRCACFCHRQRRSASPLSGSIPMYKRRADRKSGRLVFGAGDGNRTHTASLEGWNSNH